MAPTPVLATLFYLMVISSVNLPSATAMQQSTHKELMRRVPKTKVPMAGTHTVLLSESHVQKGSEQTKEDKMHYASRGHGSVSAHGVEHTALQKAIEQLEEQVVQENTAKEEAEDQKENAIAAKGVAQTSKDSHGCKVIGWPIGEICLPVCTPVGDIRYVPQWAENQLESWRQHIWGAPCGAYDATIAAEAEVITQANAVIEDSTAAVQMLTENKEGKETAAKVALTEETLIGELVTQIHDTTTLRTKSKTANDAEENELKANHNALILSLDTSISNLTETIASTQAEHDRLTLEHTQESCDEKAEKNEEICKRCAAGKACGDTCIAATSHCWYDLGCACNKGSSLLQIKDQQDPGDDAEDHAGKVTAHPLRKTLNALKAAIRKQIGAQEGLLTAKMVDLSLKSGAINETKSRKEFEEGQVAAHSQTLTDLGTNITEAEGRRDEASVEVTRLEGSVEITNAAKKLAEENVETHTTDLTNLRAEHASLTTEKIGIGAELSRQRDLLNTTTDEGEAELDKAAQQMQATITTMENDLAAEQKAKVDAIASHTSALATMEEEHALEITGLDDRIADDEKQKQEATTRLADLKAEHTDTEDINNDKYNGDGTYGDNAR